MRIFVRPVPLDITTLVRALNAPAVAQWANTNQEYRATVVPLPIHKVVLLVQTVGRHILARSVNM
jgi:hypothetical protein